jgi:hypothetical protein
MKSTSQWDEIMSMKLTQHLISYAKERKEPTAVTQLNES